MKSTIKFRVGSYEQEIVPHLFNGGELNVQVPRQYINNHDVRLLANISDAEGIMALALVNDAIRRLSPTSVSLSLGYVPYARQDRVCNPGDSCFS